MSKQHETVKNAKATFKWRIKDGREKETFNSAIHFVCEWNYIDCHRNRWGEVG